MEAGSFDVQRLAGGTQEAEKIERESESEKDSRVFSTRQQV